MPAARDATDDGKDRQRTEADKDNSGAPQQRLALESVIDSLGESHDEFRSVCRRKGELESKCGGEEHRSDRGGQNKWDTLKVRQHTRPRDAVHGQGNHPKRFGVLVDEDLDNVGLASKFLTSLVPATDDADSKKGNEIKDARREISRSVHLLASQSFVSGLYMVKHTVG